MITNDTLKTIKNRRSVRTFKAEQITEEQLTTVLDAGQHAPSAADQQAWHFTVIQSKNLIDTLNHESKEVAKTFPFEHVRNMANNANFQPYYGAPTVIIVSGREDAMVIEADCAAATQNMLLAAESIGLGACWINFALFAFNGENAGSLKQQLGLPPGFKPFYSVALGYKQGQTGGASARKENTINYIR